MPDRWPGGTLAIMSELDTYFKDKPDTYTIFKAVKKQIEACGSSDVTVGKQISFGNKRKFAWFWLYNVTSKTPQGVLHVQLAMDQKVADDHIRDVAKIGNNRWNHQIVIRTEADATSKWLGHLIEKSYKYSLG